MLQMAKFSVLVCLCMIASSAFAIQIDLPANTIVLEIEDGQMEAGVDIVNDNEASGGKAANHEVGNKTVFEVDIPSAGEWYLWIRIFCPNGDQDSYWVGMEEADGVPAEDAAGEQGLRIYSDAGDSVNTGAQPFEIWFWDCNKSNADPHSYFDIGSPGMYTLWIKGRERGTLIDQILLTPDQDFSPEEATKGDLILILQAVYPKDKLAGTWSEIKSPIAFSR